MTATAFDTLAAVRDLKAAGIEPEHAEAVGEGMRRAATARNEFAPKSHIAAVKSDIATMKSEITTLRWMFGFVAALNLAIAARLFGVV